MRLRVETDESKRTRHTVPHRTFIFAKKFTCDNPDDGAFWICFRFAWRRWTSGIGYQYNLGDGEWRSAWETYP